jgi:fermentation-respiration switch protein FrsA (DUF1100 family)
VELTSADGTRLHAWWYPHDRATGAVLYLHGNAGNLSSRGDRVVEWHDEFRESVLIIDYPGYGRSEGKPGERALYAAADAAYDWLTTAQGVRPERLLLYGSSLGGGVAVDLALRKPHRALVLACTFTSIADMGQKLYPWLPARWLVRNRFDNLAKIGKVPRPVFIAHVECDNLVPYEHGRRLFQAAPEPKDFLTLGGDRHCEPSGPHFYARVRDFLARVESRSPQAAAAPAN